MQAIDCKERVIALKEWRVKKKLTVDQCIELCGEFPSDTSIRRVFATGSEEKSFRESTLAAMEKSLIGEVYNPSIKIPVEDVIKAQRENAEIFSAKNAQLKQLLRICISVILLLVAFDVVILIYDATHLHTGFFNHASILIWFIQVVFLLVIAAVLITFSLRHTKQQK